jgi:hypothetical protein
MCLGKGYATLKIAGKRGTDACETTGDPAKKQGFLIARLMTHITILIDK